MLPRFLYWKPGRTWRDIPGFPHSLLVQVLLTINAHYYFYYYNYFVLHSPVQCQVEVEVEVYELFMSILMSLFLLYHHTTLHWLCLCLSFPPVISSNVDSCQIWGLRCKAWGYGYGWYFKGRNNNTNWLVRPGKEYLRWCRITWDCGLHQMSALYLTLHRGEVICLNNTLPTIHLIHSSWSGFAGFLYLWVSGAADQHNYNPGLQWWNKARYSFKWRINKIDLLFFVLLTLELEQTWRSCQCGGWQETGCC